MSAEQTQPAPLAIVMFKCCDCTDEQGLPAYWFTWPVAPERRCPFCRSARTAQVVGRGQIDFNPH